MLVPLSEVSAALVSFVVWPLIGWGSGLWFSRQAAHRFEQDNWVTRPRAFEHSGRFYRRRMRIQGWKDRLPEQGSFFEGGYSKAHLTDRSNENLRRFAAETRRAELVHWVNLAAGPFFLIWCPPTVGVLMIAFGVVAHLPFIATQRYNRARLTSLLTRRLTRSSASPDRPARPSASR